METFFPLGKREYRERIASRCSIWGAPGGASSFYSSFTTSKKGSWSREANVEDITFIKEKDPHVEVAGTRHQSIF